MSLHLTGKGSILSAIGGALNTGANTVVAGVKDAGDLVSAGLNTITGDKSGAQQSINAIKNNNRNLSGGNLGQNLYGLGSDIVKGGVNPIVRPVISLGAGIGEDITGDQNPNDYGGIGGVLTRYASNNGQVKNLGSPRQLLGNTIQTGVNVFTLGKGKALETAVEGGAKNILGDNLAGRVGSRVIGGTGSGALVGGAYGSGNAVANAKNPKEAISDIVTPAVQIGALGGTTGLITKAPDIIKNGRIPSEDQKGSLGPQDEVDGINNRPVPKPSDLPEPKVPKNAEDIVSHNNPLKTPSPKGREPELPEPTPEDMMQITQNLHDSMQKPIDFTKIQGANKELNGVIKKTADQLKENSAESIIKSHAAQIKNYEDGARGGQIQHVQDDYGPGHYIRTSEHGNFYRQYFKEFKRAPSKAAYLEHAKQELESGRGDMLDPEMAKAYQAAKQNPIPEEQYIEHAKAQLATDPQYHDLIQRAKAENDINDYMKADKASGANKIKWKFPKGAPAKTFIKALWDKTHSPEHAAAMDVGAQLGDVRNTIKGIQALRDQARKDLDKMAKKPKNFDEPTIRAKAAELNSFEGRLRGLKGQEQHYAMTYGNIRKALDEKYPDINLTAKKGVRLISNKQGFETARPVKTVNEEITPETTSETTPTSKSETPVKGNKFDAQSYADTFGVSLKEAKAQLAAQAKIDEQGALPERKIEGDKVILEGIKNGDSDAALVKDYIDATGVSEDEARKAVGVLDQNQHVDQMGNPENNPLYGKPANYKIGNTVEVRGLNKVLVKTKSGAQRLVDNPLINKILLRGTAPGKMLEIQRDLAKRVWDQLSPKDQALADKLRGNDIDTVLKEAKDPELFKEYANRVKQIQDTIHATRPIADPFSTDSLYRRNYGAGLHVKNGDGLPVSVDQYLGKEYSFMKDRNFNTYKDLEAASGMKRSTANFHEDVEKDVYAADKFISGHSIHNGINEAFGKGSAHFGNTDVPTGMVQLKEFPDVYAKPEIADRINDRQHYQYRKDALGKVLRGYDAINAAIKTGKLSFGGFHNINIGLSQTVLDAPGALDTIHAWGSDPFYKEQLDKAIKDGSLEKALHGGITLNAGEEFEKTGTLDKVNDLPGIKQLHSSLFQRQIPMSKLLVFQRYTKNLDLNKNYDEIRGVARVTNNIFGGINRLVDGMSGSRLKLFGRFILATDYNEGQIRTLLTAVSKGGVEGRIARQMIGGRMALLAAPGTIQALATGKAKTPEQIAKLVGHQLFNPTVQTPFKTGSGNPKQIALLATVTNKFARAVEPALQKNNPDKSSGFKQELSGNLSALASTLYSEWKNSDYYGNPLHGHGLSVGEDIGNLINQGAPIPAQPVARALENVPGLKNNPIVKIVSGGQSPINPIEAGIDVSGIGRGQANPNAPAIQIMNNRQLIAQRYKGDIQTEAGLYAVHPSWDSSLNKTQQAAIYNSPYYEGNKWAALQNPTVFNALKEQNDFAKTHGEPSNPLFDLSSKDQKTILTYKYLTEVDPGHDANDSAALLYAQNKGLISKYEKDTNSYENQMQMIYQKSGGVKGDNAPKITPGGVSYPSILQNKGNQSTLTNYLSLLDNNANSATKQQFLADHPEVSQMFNASFNYENARRASLNEPLLKDYPKVDPKLESWINTYVNSDKATRASMRNSDANSFSAMQNYMAQVDEYQLAQTAGQAKFKGAQLSQKNLKQIYDLGNYDINPTQNADGTTTYSVNPQEAFKTANGKGSKSSSSTIQKLLGDIERAHAVQAVKFAGRSARIKKQYSKRNIYLPQPKHIKVANKAPKLPSQSKTKPKSVAII